MRALFLLAFALPVVGLVACSGDERLAPLAAVVDAGADAAPDASSGAGGAGGGGVKRTVEQRDPFGDVRETQNLLWDGDFEWSSAFADQYGWLTGPPFTTYTSPKIVVGGACKSGVKCASVPGHRAILGLAVASRDKSLRVSVAAKPADAGLCSSVQVALINVFGTTSADPDVAIAATTDRPDATGWCRYEGSTGVRSQKVALYVSNMAPLAEALVDDAVIAVDVPLDARRTPAPAAPAARSAPVDDPELSRALQAARADFATLKGPHDPPPNAARRAFEAWAKKPAHEIRR